MPSRMTSRTRPAPLPGAPAGRRWRLGDILADTVVRDARHPALITGAQRVRISYGELSTAAETVAAALHRDGLRPGDVVALQSANSAAFVVALLAAIRAGIVVAPLDPALPSADKQRRVEMLGARATLVDALPADRADDCPDWLVATDSGPLPTQLRHMAAPHAGKPLAGLHADDALIMSTSGSSGVPKLVPWTHHNLAASIGGIVGGYRLGPSDATVAVMPLFHGHGLVAALLATLASGGTVLLPAKGRFTAHTFWDDVVAAGATWYTAVPTIHRILLRRAAEGGPDHRRAIPPLRFIRTCSAPIGPDTVAALESTFRTTVLAAYGMTETTHQASSVLPGSAPATRTHTVGTPTATTVLIRTATGDAAAAGEAGEVWLRGPTVARGYLGAPSTADRVALSGGWVRTGDLGLLDLDDELVITGRIKNLINRGGEKISPEHVEEVLTCHPAVLAAAVVGVPDPVYGERVAAVVVTDGTVDAAADLTEYCRTRLTSYEVPQTIVFTDALPATAKGDVDRVALRARLSHAD
jgi:acyl-CoA synthetase (AMP-forming)/AMP-acid ligase II